MFLQLEYLMPVAGYHPVEFVYPARRGTDHHRRAEILVEICFFVYPVDGCDALFQLFFQVIPLGILRVDFPFQFNNLRVVLIEELHGCPGARRLQDAAREPVVSLGSLAQHDFLI